MVLRARGYPFALLLALVGFLPAGACLRSQHASLPRADRLHRFGPLAAPGPEGQIHVFGRVAGDSIEAPTGRSCLAYSFRVVRSSGKSSTTLCSGTRSAPLELRTDEGPSLTLASDTLPPLRLDQHPQSTSFGALRLPPRCPAAGSTDRVVEQCLRPDDRAELWACLAPDHPGHLASCLDQRLESPPAGGPLAELRSSTHRSLAAALLWLAGFALATLWILHNFGLRLSLPRLPR